MVRLLLSIAVFCCVSSLLSAQSQTQKMGGMQFGITDEALINQMMAALPNVSGNTSELLDYQSVKANMMPVRDAGRGSSVLSYMLAACLEYYYNLGANYKENLSPDFISLHLRGEAESFSFGQAFHFLGDNGTVSAAILPYGSTQLTQGVHATRHFKIRNYLHLFRNTTRGRQKSFEVRKALMRGHPVLIELLANDDIYGHTSGQKYLELDKNGAQAYPLTVVGFDEALEAFEVMSSWGRNWGSNGYIWIRYDDFEEFAQNGFVLVPDLDL
jgi:C1A family cysteine protease